MAFDPSGQEYALVSYDVDNFDYTLYQFNSTGAAQLGNDVRGATTAFSPAGKIIQEVVYPNGDAYQFVDGDAGTLLGHDIQSVSVAFEPDGTPVSDVVYFGGAYYEFKGGSSKLVASNVVDASVAISKSDREVQDFVTSDGVLHEVDSSGSGTTMTLGDQVVSAGVAFDGNGGIVRTVVFTTGQAYQFDYAGQHLVGRVGDASTTGPVRLAYSPGLPL